VVKIRKIESESELEARGHDGEMRERLESLGYTDGGHVYELEGVSGDLDEILADIEDATGLRFREGEDGHAELDSRGNLRIVSKEPLSHGEEESIKNIVIK